MVSLLIVADDFTGALDTGVQFAAHGASTQVVTDLDRDFSRDEAQVLVLDAETRHLAPEAAYAAVHRAVSAALRADVPYIYKKTDSGLRGNVGSELAAAMDAAGVQSLPFVPAFPSMGRITRDGVQYVDGLPLAQSVFGRDPFEPVRFSRIGDVIAQQTSKAVFVRRPGEPGTGQGIQVYDAATDEDLKLTARALGPEGLRLSAGCAGFAAVLADLLMPAARPAAVPSLPPALLMACGSVNPVTRRQTAAAGGCGFQHVRLSVRQKLDEAWPSGNESSALIEDCLARVRRCGRVILDTNDPEGSAETQERAAAMGLSLAQTRVRVSKALAELTRGLLDRGLEATLLCVGGDTLLALMQAVGTHELTPVCEMAPGVVLTSFVYGGRVRYILAKSGGFGKPDLLCCLADRIGAGREEKA